MVDDEKYQSPLYTHAMSTPSFAKGTQDVAASHVAWFRTPIRFAASFHRCSQTAMQLTICRSTFQKKCSAAASCYFCPGTDFECLGIVRVEANVISSILRREGQNVSTCPRTMPVALLPHHIIVLFFIVNRWWCLLLNKRLPIHWTSWIQLEPWLYTFEIKQMVLVAW